jgi:hypothetical protein
VKRRKIRGLIDVVDVTDPAEIKALAGDPRLDRVFDTRTCPINWLLLTRSLAVLSFRGRRFPTMMPRGAPGRALHQEQLWSALSGQAAAIERGPEQLEPLATWVRGSGSDADVGILVQQLLGQLFASGFVATPESWRAAQILVAAPRSTNWPKMAWWFASGKVRRAQRLLASMVNDDLSAVNAIGIAVHNVVKGMRHLRLLYADGTRRAGLSAADAVGESLFAPVSIYRQATEAGQLGDCPYSRHSLFVLSIGQASQQAEGRPLVFMDDTWSQCPANVWVPAMLRGVWTRACAAVERPRSATESSA